MYSNIFNCFTTKSISISFNCDNCGQRIDEEIYDIYKHREEIVEYYEREITKTQQRAA